MRLVLLLAVVALTAEARSPVKVKRAVAGSGGVAPTAPIPPSLLCDAMAPGDSAGGWWCLNGDGTMEAGSAITMVANGSTLDVMPWDVCGGTGCYTESHTRLNPTMNGGNPAPTASYYTTAATSAAPTGSFTTCWLGRIEKPASDGTIGAQLLLSYSTSGGADSWEMVSAGASAATGLQTYMTGGAAPCSAGTHTCVDSGVRTVTRQTSLQCSIFTASTGFTSCTYTQGAGVTCVAAASATAAMGATARKWQVGAGAGFAATAGMNGFLRGAFMTEKALSSVDVARIGDAVLPPAPAGMLFTRASARTCGATSGTVELANNVPCIRNYYVEVEASMIEKVDQTEQFGSWNLTCCQGGPPPTCNGGCTNPTQVAGQAYSPFGMKSVAQLNFPVSGSATINYSVNVERGGFSGSAAQTWTYTAEVMGVPGVSDTGTIQIRGTDGNVGSYTSSCPFTSLAFTTCSVTVPMVFTFGATVSIGAFDGTARPAMSIYATNVNVQNSSPISSYVRGLYTLGSVTRAAEVCGGTGCPPNHIY